MFVPAWYLEQVACIGRAAGPAVTTWYHYCFSLSTSYVLYPPDLIFFLSSFAVGGIRKQTKMPSAMSTCSLPIYWAKNNIASSDCTLNELLHFKFLEFRDYRNIIFLSTTTQCPRSRGNCLLSSCYGNVSVDWFPHWKFSTCDYFRLEPSTIIRRNSNVWVWKLETFLR